MPLDIISRSNLDLVNRLNATPLQTRLALIVTSALQHPNAPFAVCRLVATAAIMASELPVEHQADIAAFMHAEANALAPPCVH